MSKRQKVAKKARKRALRVVEANPAMIPLLEMFAACDDVFTTEDSFSDEHIKKSLGRIYRQWKKTRADLDPEFDPKKYPKKPRRRGEETTKSKRIVLKTTDRR